VTKPDQLTSQAITAWYEAKPQDFRDHLGASLIGHSCNRYLWLTFRWAVMPKFEGRMLRLFNTGNREEIRIAEELRGIGVELYTDEDGKQISVRDESGHFGGSVDGIGKNFPELIERHTRSDLRRLWEGGHRREIIAKRYAAYYKKQAEKEDPA